MQLVAKISKLISVEVIVAGNLLFFFSPFLSSYPFQYRHSKIPIITIQIIMFFFQDLYPETKSCSYKSHSNDVTNVFLDDDSDDDERPNTDFYFSRKDSILRIPIAPRTSNRKLSIQKIVRHSFAVICQQNKTVRCEKLRNKNTKKKML